MQTGEAQSQRLIPTKHTVHGLNGVTSRAFHQIIQGRKGDNALILDIQPIYFEEKRRNAYSFK